METGTPSLVQPPVASPLSRMQARRTPPSTRSMARRPWRGDRQLQAPAALPEPPPSRVTVTVWGRATRARVLALLHEEALHEARLAIAVGLSADLDLRWTLQRRQALTGI